MKLRLALILTSVLTLVTFTIFSYTVAKEKWQKIDFDTTVKLQDHISRRFDNIFSYFSLLGSTEVTIGFCLILAAFFLVRGKFWAVIGWLMIIPASMAEIFGKLVLFHPAPPVFLHRSILPTTLPSFYVHTDFSYPSGHITRTFFILTILGCLVFFSRMPFFIKFNLIVLLIGQAILMTLTRVYLGEHWLSDTLGGGLLGIAVGLFATVLILPKDQVLPTRWYLCKIRPLAPGR